MSESERRKILAEALQEAMAAPEVGKRRRGSSPPRNRQRSLLFITLLGWAVLGWIWIARPAAIFNSGQAAPAVSAEQREARLRYAIYLQRHEIAAFLRQNGRLPATLADAELDRSAGLRLEFGADGGWAVVGDHDGTPLRLTDRMDADSFLGNSLTILEAAR